MRILAHHPTTAGLALLLALVCSVGAANPPISIDAKVDRGELTVRYQGRKLLVYAFATNQFKPYVRELYTLRGENVLRDAVPDHLHHHGLMYAANVNGINFWEERGAAGFEKHIELPLHSARIDAKGMPVTDFTELIHWLAPTNKAASDSFAAALLIEQRTLTLAIDEKNQEVALRWDSQFQVGPNAGKVTIHGPNYDGLGLRLPESFNHVARFQNSTDQPYVGQNTQNVIPARWTSVAGVIDGHEVMLAMFGHPDNARGDTVFFTMLDAFAYLSATQGLDKNPLEYSAGDKFSLSYLLTVYSANKSPEFIRQRSELWEKERK
jgi:Methane oxygenase PmoA